MEDNIQVIVGAIISVFLLFIFPVYMAYEKMDDIAYALTMKYTQEFVDSVKTKGYITSDMLENYKNNLRATGNSFDVQLTHGYTRTDPITNYYTENEGVYTLVLTKTQSQRLKDEQGYIDTAIDTNLLSEDSTEEEKEQAIADWYKDNGYDKIEDTYRYSKEEYTTEQIESVLRTEKKLWPNATTENFVCVDEKEPRPESITEQIEDCVYAYTMNEGDTFNVTVKNTNTTAATIIYNMVTINTVDKNTRIYVNYGGEILNTQWTGKIDYTKINHTGLSLYNLTEYSVVGNENGKPLQWVYDSATAPNNKPFLIDVAWKRYEAGSWITSGTKLKERKENNNDKAYDGEKGYIFEFEVKPYTTTDLRADGYELKANEYTNYYNPAVGNTKDFAISAGINGITIIYKNEVILSHPMTINQFIPVKLYMKKVSDGIYKVVLYIDNVRVAESVNIAANSLDMPKITYVGLGMDNQKVFEGHIRNIKIHI